MTGDKWTAREYLSYTGYPGGQRVMTPARLQAKGSERLFKKVLKGMLPKNRLGAQILKNIYVFDGAEHNKAAQNPKNIDINALK
jgi:large subunit ribosomal protein L13